MIRLYAALDFSLRRSAELPEVLTHDATALLLYRAALGDTEGDVPLLDEPSPDAAAHARQLLSLWD